MSFVTSNISSSPYSGSVSEEPAPSTGDMSDDDSYHKDPVPSSVGEGSRTYYIDKSKIGSGHFGDVYRGTHRSTGKRVAIKLEHRSASIALREREVYRCLAGDGAPKVYYTGRHGSYYVLVMDLLGCTLQTLLESSPNRRLPWDVVSAVGYKGIKLLENLHSKGYVHGKSYIPSSLYYGNCDIFR